MHTEKYEQTVAINYYSEQESQLKFHEKYLIDSEQGLKTVIHIIHRAVAKKHDFRSLRTSTIVLARV